MRHTVVFQQILNEKVEEKKQKQIHFKSHALRSHERKRNSPLIKLSNAVARGHLRKSFIQCPARTWTAPAESSSTRQTMTSVPTKPTFEPSQKCWLMAWRIQTPQEVMKPKQSRINYRKHQDIIVRWYQDPSSVRVILGLGLGFVMSRLIFSTRELSCCFEDELKTKNYKRYVHQAHERPQCELSAPPLTRSLPPVYSASSDISRPVC